MSGKAIWFKVNGEVETFMTILLAKLSPNFGSYVNEVNWK